MQFTQLILDTFYFFEERYTSFGQYLRKYLKCIAQPLRRYTHIMQFMNAIGIVNRRTPVIHFIQTRLRYDPRIHKCWSGSIKAADSSGLCHAILLSLEDTTP